MEDAVSTNKSTMASVASASPSGYGFPRAESTDESEPWQYIDSSSGSVRILPSPASGSLNSWDVVGYPSQAELPLSAVSPLQLSSPEMEHAHAYSSSLPMAAGASMMPPTSVDGTFVTAMGGGLSEDQQFMGPPETMFSDQYDSESHALNERPGEGTNSVKIPLIYRHT